MAGSQQVRASAVMVHLNWRISYISDTVRANVDDQRFWPFSLDVYARPGIADACLRLQDDYGCDVNILLFCCWAAVCGAGRLEEKTMSDAVARVEEWQTDVIKPVRTVRRRLESQLAHADPKMAAQLKVEIGAAELHAENVEQDMLEKLVTPAMASRGDSGALLEDAHYNLLGYLKLLRIDPEGEALDLLSTLVAGCCAKQ